MTVEYHYLEGQYDRLPGLVTDLVRRQVAVIATPGCRRKPILSQALKRPAYETALASSQVAMLAAASP